MTPESARSVNQHDLESHSRMGVFSEFNASNMAAGPCSRAANLDGKRFRPEDAPVPPFDDCPHPDQCACMYRAVLTLKGEF